MERVVPVSDLALSAEAKKLRAEVLYISPPSQYRKAVLLSNGKKIRLTWVQSEGRWLKR